MKRVIYVLAVTLLLAGIVHILIVLLIPSYASKDAWAKLEATGKPWEFSVVSDISTGKSILPLVDPAFQVAACRYNLAEAAVSVKAAGNLPFWSVAIFDRQGRNIYSFTDRTAIERNLFLIVVNSVQMALVRKNPPKDSEKSVLVESASQEGFILIRALQEDESWQPSIRKFMEDVKCEKLDLTKIETTASE